MHRKPIVVGLVVSALAGLTAMAAPVSYQNAVLADNPIAYYRLGEASGTTAVNQTGAGFDGVDDFADAPLQGFGSLLGSSSIELILRTTTNQFGSITSSFHPTDGVATGFGLRVNATTGSSPA